jgi:hypothetical protein
MRTPQLSTMRQPDTTAHWLTSALQLPIEWGAFIYKMGHPSWLDRLSKMLQG